MLLKVNQEMRRAKRMRRESVFEKAPTLQLSFQFVTFGRGILTESFRGFPSSRCEGFSANVRYDSSRLIFANFRHLFSKFIFKLSISNRVCVSNFGIYRRYIIAFKLLTYCLTLSLLIIFSGV